MKKKFTLLMMMLLMVVLLVTACNKPEEPKVSEEPKKTEEKSEVKEEKKEEKQEEKKEEAKTDGKELLVYSGAGLKNPMEKIKEEFEKEKGISINLIYAGSGQLLAQLEQSGKGDVFIVGSAVRNNLCKLFISYN